MNQQAYQKDEIDLIDYIKIAYRRRWLIAAMVIITMLYAGIKGLSEPKVFEASATFFPLNMNTNIQSKDFLIKPSLDIEDLIIAILESRKMQDRIIERLDLKRAWNSESMIDLRKALKLSTTITLEKKKGLIRLAVQDSSAKLAAEITNAYVDNLDYFNSQLDLGVQRQLVQVIDTATIPEKRMPRDTVKKTVKAGSFSFVFAIFLAFFIDFIQKNDIKKRLKEK